MRSQWISRGSQTDGRTLPSAAGPLTCKEQPKRQGLLRCPLVVLPSGPCGVPHCTQDSGLQLSSLGWPLSGCFTVLYRSLQWTAPIFSGRSPAHRLELQTGQFSLLTPKLRQHHGLHTTIMTLCYNTLLPRLDTPKHYPLQRTGRHQCFPSPQPCPSIPQSSIHSMGQRLPHVIRRSGSPSSVVPVDTNSAILHACRFMG